MFVCRRMCGQTTGCRWTGITVSKAQLEEAGARVKAAGLRDAVTLLFCDYRDAPQLGTFDKVRRMRWSSYDRRICLVLPRCALQGWHRMHRQAARRGKRLRVLV